MKKTTLFLWLIFLPILLAAQQTNYSRVKIFLDGKTVGQLFATGIETIQADTDNKWFIAEISDREMKKLSENNFHYEVIIPDLESFYTNRIHESSPATTTDRLLDETWPVPANFSLGTCGGFSTLDQMLAQLDLMRALFPSLISVKQSICDTLTTIEGREIYYVRLSDNPDVNEAEPEVLYTGLHHAREPIGMQHLLYYMWYLLENYDSDPSIKALVDNTEMYFVPVFNADGYQYNVTNDPNGGGMWRKNRRDNGDGSFGIDVNRNYGYQWGYDDIGSSSVPSDETYRGTGPFSEPETRMMKSFCESHEFKIALNYHAYSNLFLFAWGWTSVLCPDNNLLDSYARLMTEENSYTYGPASTTIYPTNGGSDDWMYGEQAAKPVIFAYTPEVGNNNDGFWPVQDRIIPLCQENMLASLTAAKLAGNYGTIADNSPFFIWEHSGYLPFNVNRLGLQEDSFTVSVTPLGDAFADVGNPKVIEGLALLEEHPDSISYQFTNSLHVGDTIRYVLNIDNGYFTEHDTVMRIFGYPVNVFDDKLTSNGNWTGNWSLTNSVYFSPLTSMTDSPFGNYSANANKSTTLKTEISLNNTLLMVLQFRARWAIENDYDYVQLSISDDNGATWSALAGNYTNAGGVNQASGEPVYDGNQPSWVREAISLNEYMGKKIKLRFRLKTDLGTQMDGFYFDDINISMLLDPTELQEQISSKTMLGIPYPNPASNHFKVKYNLPEAQSQGMLSVFTPSGKEIFNTKLENSLGTADINISNLAGGIYFMRLTSNGIQSTVRKLIVK